MSTATDNMKLAPNGKPFKNEDDAKKAMAVIPMDPDVWGVCQFEGGYVIAKHSWIATRLRDEVKERDRAVGAANVKPLRYLWVKLAGHSNPNEYNKVPVGVNGLILWVTRNVKVPLPENYVEVLRDAVQKQFEESDNPEVPYREVGSLHRYPLEVLGEATAADFKKVFEEQRTATEEAIRTAGNKK